MAYNKIYLKYISNISKGDEWGEAIKVIKEDVFFCL